MIIKVLELQGGSRCDRYPDCWELHISYFSITPAGTNASLWLTQEWAISLWSLFQGCSKAWNLDDIQSKVSLLRFLKGCSQQQYLYVPGRVSVDCQVQQLEFIAWQILTTEAFTHWVWRLSEKKLKWHFNLLLFCQDPVTWLVCVEIISHPGHGLSKC